MSVGISSVNRSPSALIVGGISPSQISCTRSHQLTNAADTPSGYRASHHRRTHTGPTPRPSGSISKRVRRVPSASLNQSVVSAPEVVGNVAVMERSGSGSVVIDADEHDLGEPARDLTDHHQQRRTAWEPHVAAI